MLKHDTLFEVEIGGIDYEIIFDDNNLCKRYVCRGVTVEDVIPDAEIERLSYQLILSKKEKEYKILLNWVRNDKIRTILASKGRKITQQ